MKVAGLATFSILFFGAGKAKDAAIFVILTILNEPFQLK
jgi:hypothetical protein